MSEHTEGFDPSLADSRPATDNDSSLPRFLQLIAETGSLTQGSIQAASESAREHHVEGGGNFPDRGGVIVVNHFVTDTGLPLEEKWDQTMELIGIINRQLISTDESYPISWVVSTTPRSAVQSGIVLPSDEARERILTQAPDIIPVSYTSQGMRQFLDTAFTRLRQGGRVGIFSEERTTPVLGEAGIGFSHLAIRTNSPVSPVAAYGTANELTVSVGDPLLPPPHIKGRTEFTEEVMRSLAGMLPESNRGYYR